MLDMKRRVISRGDTPLPSSPRHIMDVESGVREVPMGGEESNHHIHYSMMMPPAVAPNNRRRRWLFLIVLMALAIAGLLKVRPRSSLAAASSATTTTSSSSSSSSFSLRGKQVKKLADIHWPPSAHEIDNWNAQLLSSGAEVDDILRWAYEQFLLTGKNLIQVSSFGPSGMVVVHKLHQLGLLNHIPTNTIDTLHLFPETYEFIETVKRTYPEMKLQVYKPPQTKESFDQEYGADLYKTNPDMYSYLSKVEPLKRALNGTAAWITGRRRSQGGERSDLTVLELDTENDDAVRVKINPLAYWSYDDVWAYIRHHRVPYNPLHDKGYKSIGDTMTSLPVDANADERSGRFVGLNRTECGIHSHLEKVKRIKEQQQHAGEDSSGDPTVPCQDCVDLDTKSFKSVVIKGDTDLLLEFYSPYCGACQQFGPKLDEIATKLRNKLQVVRFDLTENDIPKAGRKLGLKVEVTPTLYLIQRKPSFKATEYKGEHEVKSFMKWLEWKTK